MSDRETYWVQTFVKERDQVVPGHRIDAPGEADAMGAAEGMIANVAGAAALRLTMRDDGKVSGGAVLGTFGEVPVDYAETLPDEILANTPTPE